MGVGSSCEWQKSSMDFFFSFPYYNAVCVCVCERITERYYSLSMLDVLKVDSRQNSAPKV